MSQIESELFSDDSSGSDDGWIERQLLESSKGVFSEADEVLGIEKLEDEIPVKYSKIMDDDVQAELITIENLKASRNELVNAFEEEESLESQAVHQLNELRRNERETGESLAKEEVRRMKSALYNKFLGQQKVRRRRYKEISDLARYKFRYLEDRLHMKLLRKNAQLDPSKKDINIRKQQWRLRWRKEPNLLNFRIVQLRSVGEKLPDGEYCLLISLYDCFGGNAITYSRHGSKIKRATLPVYHSGKHTEPNFFFEQLLQVTCPSLDDLTMRMVIVFEILHLKVFGREGEDNQDLFSRSNVNMGAVEESDTRMVNKTVGWSAFPLVDNNKDFIRGFYKTPILKGEVDFRMDSFEQMEKKMRHSVDSWLGNLYFEVDHGGVDTDIAENEEFVLEVLHEEGSSDASTGGHGDEVIFEGDTSLYSDQMYGERMHVTQLSYKLDDEEDERTGASVLMSEDEDDLSSSSSFLSTKKETESVIEIKEKDEEEDEGEDQEEDQLLDIPPPEERKESKSILPEHMENVALETKKQLLLENPRIWFGQPQFGVIRKQRDKINAEKEEITKTVFSKQTGLLGMVESGSEMKHSSTIENLAAESENVPSGEEENKESTNAMGETMYLSANFFSPFSKKARKKRNSTLIKKKGDESSIGGGLGAGLGATLWGSIKKKVVETSIYPQKYEDTFVYQADEFAVTRDRTQTTCTILDARDPKKSLFANMFKHNGISRMDLSLYKTAVKRKKFHWNQKSVYMEKFLFVSRFSLIDMGLSNFRSFEFYLMLFLAVMALYLVRFPHNIGQWFWLSFFKVPIKAPFANPLYIRFEYKTEDQSTFFNFGYVVAGTVFNILLSLFLVVFLWISRILFKTLPNALYRLATLFIVAVAVDPFIFFFQDLFAGLLYPAIEPYGEAFVLPDYYKVTEGSELPGILLTVAIIIPVMAIQFFLVYQYIVHINFNRRIMDVFKRLNKPERKFFVPNDLEISEDTLLSIVEDAKKVSQIGSSKHIVTSIIPEDLREIIVIQRLRSILDAVLWPKDYISFCLAQHGVYNEGLGQVLEVPDELYMDKRPSAVLHRETMVGKMFVIRDFENLVKCLMFDSEAIDSEKKRYVVNVFKKYNIVHELLVERLSNNNVVTAHLMHEGIKLSDVDTVYDNNMELDIPTSEQVLKEKRLPWNQWIKKRVLRPLMERFKRGKPKVVPVTQVEFESSVPPKDQKKNGNNDALDPTTSLHIQIFVQGSTGRLANYRNFVQTSDGAICEVFSTARNQLSVSNISRRGSMDYWVYQTENKIKREGSKRKKKYRKRLINVLNRTAFARGLRKKLRKKRRAKMLNMSM